MGFNGENQMDVSPNLEGSFGIFPLLLPGRTMSGLETVQIPSSSVITAKSVQLLLEPNLFPLSNHNK